MNLLDISRLDGKGWTFVKDLKVGDFLAESDGNTLKIDSIELLHKHVTVYNMTVTDFHTYFVSDLGIWVHNIDCTVNPGDLTPGGRTFTGHAAWRVNNRGFTVENIDNIINNNKRNRVSKIDSEGKKRGNILILEEIRS